MTYLDEEFSDKYFESKKKKVLLVTQYYLMVEKIPNVSDHNSFYKKVHFTSIGGPLVWVHYKYNELVRLKLKLRTIGIPT